MCSVGDGGGYGRRVDPITLRMSFHAGLDFDVEAGYPVFAAAAGRVLFAELKGPYGLAIDVDHGRRHSTRYGHLSALAVSEGQFVPQGASIGWSGVTGRTLAPVLHFEIWRDDVVRNPGPLIRPN